MYTSKGNVLRVILFPSQKCSFTILNIVFIYTVLKKVDCDLYFTIYIGVFVCFSGQDHITYTTFPPNLGFEVSHPSSLNVLYYGHNAQVRKALFSIVFRCKVNDKQLEV